MPNNLSKPLTFNVLVQQHNEAYVGHCIETNIVASGLDEQDVLAKMGKLLMRQVAFALEHDRLQDIYHPVPKEIFQEYMRVEERLIEKKSTPMWRDSKPWFTLEQNAYAPAC